MQSITTKEHWIPMHAGQLFAKSWLPEQGSPALQAPIVLFHDSLGCVVLWRDFPAKLAASTGRRVIAYDRLGFGRSSAHPGGWSVDFIQDEASIYFPALQSALGFQRFIAFGYSVGGAMATYCAACYHSDCEGLITMSAQAFVDEQVLEGIRVAKHTFDQPGQLARLEKYHGDKARWVLSAWCDTWLSQDFAPWTIDRGANGLRCPHLVIHGDHDEYGSLAHPRHIAALTRGPSELLILENCRHTPHREHPELVVAAVSEFVS